MSLLARSRKDGGKRHHTVPSQWLRPNFWDASSSSDEDAWGGVAPGRTNTSPTIAGSLIERQRQRTQEPLPLGPKKKRRDGAVERVHALADVSIDPPGVVAYDETDGDSQHEIAAFPPAAPLEVDTVIIFDWDDTLFPTWFMAEVVMPCHPEVEGSKLPSDSPFAPSLVQHARTVQRLLYKARSIGRVGIVTLAARPWVLSSAAAYLLEFDFKQLLRELKIPVVYARECVKSRDIDSAKVEEGVNVWTIAKQNAMLKILKKLHGSRSGWKNIISIGDSVIERDAIKDLLWGSLEAPFCKTVKLVEDPSASELGTQLKVLTRWLPRMAAYSDDFDLNLDESEGAMMFM